MRPVSTPTLYIRLCKNRKIRRGAPIHLGEIADLLSTDPELERELKRLVLYRPKEQDGALVLIDMMLILRSIKERQLEVRIEHFGEPHTLVEIEGQTRGPSVILIVLVWLLLFVGSGLAIMNFHTDVSMAQVHRQIYRLLTGREQVHPLLLQIPYSIGIGVGMVLFFNHLFKKKFNEEPSPLEVEMYMYQENVNQYVIAEEYAKQPKECGEGPGKGHAP